MSDAHLDRFRRLSMLLLVIERLAASPRVRGLSFHDEQERQVGSLRLDAGMVETGADLQGRPYIDEAFFRDGAPVAATLQKLLQGQALSVSEGLQLHRIPLIARRCLCGVTARALRQIAQLCDLNKIRIVDQPAAKDPRPTTERYTFSPVELLLAAGRQGDVRYADVAARLYEEPPGTAEERWLFEWQPDDSDGPWPIMTTRMAERKTATVAQFGLLGQSLTHPLSRQRGATSNSLPAATLASTELHTYYSVTSERYVALFVYSIRQQDRLLKSLEDLIYLPKESARPIANQNSSKRSPSVPISDTARHVPIADLPASWAGSSSTASPGPGAAGLASDTGGGPTLLGPTAGAAGARRDEASEWLSAADLAGMDALSEPPPSAQALASSRVSRTAQPSPTAQAPKAAPGVPAAESPAATVSTQHASPVPVAKSAAEHKTDSPPVTVTGHVGDPPRRMLAGAAAEASSAVTLPELAEAEAADEAEARKPLLRAQRFCASFDGKARLEDVDLSLARRGVYALIAPTREAGSVLFGILGGRHREANGWTFGGDLWFDDAPLGQSLRPVILGPQIAASSLSIRSYLLQDLPAEAAASFSRPRLLNLLMEVGLGHLARQPDSVLNSPALQLSTGEWWLLAIARELIREPKLLCLDDPLVGLSPGHSAALARLLRQQGERRTILLSTRSESDASACQAIPLYLPGYGALPSAQHAERALDSAPEGSPARLPLQVASPARSADPVLPTAPTMPEPTTAAVRAAERPSALPSPAPNRPHPAEPPSQPLLQLRRLSIQLHKLLLLPTTSVEIAGPGLYLWQSQRATARKALIRLLCGEPAAQMQISGSALWQGANLLTEHKDRPLTPPRQAHWLLRTGREYLQDCVSGAQPGDQGALLPSLVQVLELTGSSNLLQRLDVALCDLPAHERRQLELVRCIRLSPRLIVLDDPLIGLGPDERPHLLQLLRTAARSSAVLVVTRESGLYCGDREQRTPHIFRCDEDGDPDDDLPSARNQTPGLGNALPKAAPRSAGQQTTAATALDGGPEVQPKRVSHASL